MRQVYAIYSKYTPYTPYTRVHAIHFEFTASQGCGTRSESLGACHARKPQSPSHVPEPALLSTGVTPCRFPKLSSVSLAFLEASCRRQGIQEWRVYDVVATMRQQKERQQQARLPQPAKRSHHFRDDTPDEIEPDTPSAGTAAGQQGDGGPTLIGAMCNSFYFM